MQAEPISSTALFLTHRARQIERLYQMQVALLLQCWAGSLQEYGYLIIMMVLRQLKSIHKSIPLSYNCSQYFQIVNMDIADFDKMDEYQRRKQEKQQGESHVEQPTSNLNTANLENYQITKGNEAANIFKPSKWANSKDFRHQTITKWDTFEPRAFNRLSNKHKEEHFLQLFDDYMQTKARLNEQLDRVRKLSANNVRLEDQAANLRRKSPDRPLPKGRRQEKTENQQLKQEVKRLHQKIIALTDNKPKITALRPQSAANKKQKVILPTTQDIKAELQIERKQVKQLLIIIDQLKTAKFSLETQLKEKQQSAAVPRVKNVSGVGNANLVNQSRFQDFAYELQKWKQKYNDLELCFNKMSQDKERRIKQLEIQNLDLKENDRSRNMNVNFNKLNEINKQFFDDKIDTLERQNERLENQIRRLVQLPFNQSNDNQNQINLQNKNIQLESALQKMKDDLNKTRQNSNKYLADLEFKNRQSALLKGQNDKLKKQVKQLIQKQTNARSTMDTQIDYDDYYRKLMGLVKLQGDDPVWRKFASLATPSFQSLNQAQLKIQAQQLWKSKLQLLAHLQKAQIELKVAQQSTELRVGLYLKDKQALEEELRQAKARLDEWSSMERVNARRQVQLYSSAGIKYDDSISVFDADESQLKDLDNIYNYFDLYLGLLNLDEVAITKNPSNRIKDVTKIVSFLTVDFYNHDTQHSHFAEGNARKLDNNFSFRVEMNQSLVKFLTKQTLVLELWSPQGSNTVMLGKGEIWLRDLVSNASKDVSAVVRGKCPFYQADRSLVATVEYRIRMRLPIGSICEWSSKDESKIGRPTDLLRLGQRKRLEISIFRALGMSSTSSCFVYFNIQGEDYFTEAVRGSSPQWNYRKEIQMMMNEELEEEMKQNYFQFTIFDDERPVNQDIIGFAKADLTRMIDSLQKMQADLDIKNKEFEVVGKLKVQFKWV